MVRMLNSEADVTYLWEHEAATVDDHSVDP
jgi:hypothetical protein